MKNKSKSLTLFLAMALAIFLSSCLKDYDLPQPDKPTAPDNGGFAVKSSSMTATDTTESAANVAIIFYLENQTGISFDATWNFGDGTPYAIGPGLSQVSHKYNGNGIYYLSVTIDIGATSYVLNHVVKVGLSGGGLDFRMLHSSLVTSGSMAGAYNYTFGVRKAFYDPAWHVGDHSNWSQVSIASTDTMIINGEVWATWHVVRYNGLESQSFGSSAGAWVYYPSSIYWYSTGSQSGVFHTYCYNGVVYPSQQSLVIPGIGGDPINGAFAPTIRFSVETSSQGDSLLLFFNNDSYFNGPSPFVSGGYDETGNNWTTQAQTLMSGSDWGFISLSVHQIMNNGGMYYFKAGGNIAQVNQTGDMTKSMFYNPSPDCLLLQLAEPITAGGPKYIVSVHNRKFAL